MQRARDLRAILFRFTLLYYIRYSVRGNVEGEKKLGCCASASGSRGWLGKVQRIGRSPRTHHLGEVVLKRAVGVGCRFPAAVRRYTFSSPASRDRLVPSCNSCSVCQVTLSAVGGPGPLAGLPYVCACGVLSSDGTFEPCQFSGIPVVVSWLCWGDAGRPRRALGRWRGVAPATAHACSDLTDCNML